MNITEKAMENYKKLFSESVEKENLDEELMEIILNFSLDEAQEYDKLDEKTRQMVILAATIATQTPKRYMEVQRNLQKKWYHQELLIECVARKVI